VAVNTATAPPGERYRGKSLFVKNNFFWKSKIFFWEEQLLSTVCNGFFHTQSYTSVHMYLYLLACAYLCIYIYMYIHTQKVQVSTTDIHVQADSCKSNHTYIRVYMFICTQKAPVSTSVHTHFSGKGTTRISARQIFGKNVASVCDPHFQNYYTKVHARIYIYTCYIGTRIYIYIYVCIYVNIFIYVHIRHTATHCSTLQHTATHRNTLQHTAIHCTCNQV